jgi:hypothetical protein
MGAMRERARKWRVTGDEWRAGIEQTLAVGQSGRFALGIGDTHLRVFLRKSLESLENKGVEEMEVAKEFVRICKERR